MPYCQTNGIQTYYEVRGSGFPLLLITGLTGDSFLWTDAFLSPLEEKFKVILYDPRCAGRSDWPTERFDFQTLVADLKDLVDHLGIQKLNLYGVSMGSIIAQFFTIKYPNIVQKVILASALPNLSFVTESGWNHLESHRKGEYIEDRLKITEFLLGKDVFEVQKEVIETMILNEIKLREEKSYPSQSAEAFRNQLDSAKGDWDTSNDLKDLNNEFLILKPEADYLVDPEASEFLNNIIQNSRIIRYPNAPHGTLPPLVNPDMTPVLDFLLIID